LSASEKSALQVLRSSPTVFLDMNTGQLETLHQFLVQMVDVLG